MFLICLSRLVLFFNFLLLWTLSADRPWLVLVMSDKGSLRRLHSFACALKGEWFPQGKGGREQQSGWREQGTKPQKHECTWHIRESVRYQGQLGHWITRAFREEKPERYTGLRLIKTLKIMLRHLDLTLGSHWRFSLGLCSGASYG